MSDRELLKMAAKAAGFAWVDGHVSTGLRDRDGRVWNPLTNDGDALRLFLALPWMCLETSDVGVTVRERGKADEPSRVYLMWTEWLDKHGNDLAAATRRAIVRAAAEIGRGMK